MNVQIIQKYSLCALTLVIVAALTLAMLALSSIFFKIYLKTLFHYFGVSHLFGISEQNTFSMTALLLISCFFIFVLIRHNITESLLTFLIFIASYGIYGYLFATFHALGNHTKPLLPSILILFFFASTLGLSSMKKRLDIHTLTPGLQNFMECFLWTSVFLVSSYSFYPKARPDLLLFPLFVFIKGKNTLSEPSIFFTFFIICLTALVVLVALQSKKLRHLLFCLTSSRT